MKTVLKITAIGFGLFVTGILILALAMGGDPEVQQLKEENIQEQIDKEAEKKVAEENKKAEAQLQAERKQEQADAIAEMQASRVSFEEFTSIETGMSKDQVVDIIGGPLELLSESGTAQMYMAEGVGSPGANANFTFIDGKLYAKAQFGLGGN